MRLTQKGKIIIKLILEQGSFLQSRLFIFFFNQTSGQKGKIIIKLILEGVYLVWSWNNSTRGPFNVSASHLLCLIKF